MYRDQYREMYDERKILWDETDARRYNDLVDILKDGKLVTLLEQVYDELEWLHEVAAAESREEETTLLLMEKLKEAIEHLTPHEP